MRPCSIIELPGGSDHLLGLTCVPQARDVMVLSGTLLNAEEKKKATDMKRDEKRETDDRSVNVVGQLAFCYQEPLLWEDIDVPTSLSLADVQRVVQDTAQREDEKFFSCLERRLDSLERAMNVLLCKNSITNE